MGLILTLCFPAHLSYDYEITIFNKKRKALMLHQPLSLQGADKWTGLSFLALVIHADQKIYGSEIECLKQYFKNDLDQSDIDYVQSLLKKPLDVSRVEQIDTPSNSAIAKELVVAAVTIGVVDGEYTAMEKDIINRWIKQNNLHSGFLESVENYIYVCSALSQMGKQLVQAEKLDEELKAQLKALRQCL